MQQEMGAFRHAQAALDAALVAEKQRRAKEAVELREGEQQWRGKHEKQQVRSKVFGRWFAWVLFGWVLAVGWFGGSCVAVLCRCVAVSLS
eukprot:2282256-Rhodomonas_salina.1